METTHSPENVVKPVQRKIPVDCPVCENSHFKVKYEPTVAVDDPIKLYGAASGVKGTQTLVVCTDCGLLYENPRFPEELILEGYMSANEEGHDSQYQMRRKSFLSALNSIRKYLPQPGARVLDIGTAGGAFLDAAKDYGYEAFGIEPSRFLVEQGQRRGLNMVQGTVESHPLKSESFDLVCFWDVLEHVVDPKEKLRQVKSLLKPNGMVLVNYPDIGTMQAKLAGKRFWWILSVHLHHFSRSTIRRTAELTGYELVRFKPYWQKLEFGYLEKMAVHLKVPLAGFLEKLTPGFIQRIPFPYYASQTTALLRPIPDKG